MLFFNCLPRRRLLAVAYCLALSGLFLSGCSSSSSSSADTSGSTSAAAVAAMGSGVNGTAMDASSHFLVHCPTAVSGTNGDGTCGVSIDVMTLAFTNSSGCSYAGTAALWSGGTVLTTTGAPPVCGTFPTLGTGGVTSVNRTYLNVIGGSGSPTFRVNALGTETVAVDTSVPSGAFVAATTTSIAGKTVSGGTGGFDYNIATGQGYTRSGSASSATLSIAIRAVDLLGDLFTTGGSGNQTVVFDHTVSTQDSSLTNHPLTVTVSAGVHTVNGTMYVQHNLAKSLATVTATNLTYTPASGCCYPTSGTMSVYFAGGLNSGLTETTTFSSASCTSGTVGQVAFTDVKGTASTKTFSHCF